MTATTAAAILADLDILTGTYAPNWNHGRPYGLTFDDFGDQFAIVDTKPMIDRVVRVVNGSELIRIAEEDADKGGQTVYEKTTARKLLSNLYGVEHPALLDEADRDEASWIEELANAHGWDSDVYRADSYFGEGEYRTTPIEPIDAAIDWLENHDPAEGFSVRRCRWMTDEELEAYFTDDEE